MFLCQKFVQGLCAVVALGSGASALAAPVIYQLSKEKSEIKWTGKKEIGDGHHGTVSLAGGEVAIDGTDLKEANITIDMTSIINADVKDPTYNKKLVDHLKSEDFFKVDTFKTAVFKSTAASKIENGSAALQGQLQIRGKSGDFTINLSDIKVTPNSAAAIGKLVFDRTNFDVKYNSASFPDLFKIAKDKIIKNEVELDFKILANKKGSPSL